VKKVAESCFYRLHFFNYKIIISSKVVSYGCQNGSVRIFYPASGTIKTLGMHIAKVTDIKVRTSIQNPEKREIEIAPIVVSAAEDGSVKIWYEGGRTFACDGHRFKVC
jgi:hypothetical protein